MVVVRQKSGGVDGDFVFRLGSSEDSVDDVVDLLGRARQVTTVNGPGRDLDQTMGVVERTDAPRHTMYRRDPALEPPSSSKKIFILLIAEVR